MTREERVEASKKVRYVHLHCENGGCVTIATVRHPQNPAVGHFGFAYCSPKDQFKKALGRKLAFVRLMDGLLFEMAPWLHNGDAPPIITYIAIDTVDPEKPFERSLKALQEVHQRQMVPQWFSKTDIMFTADTCL